MFSGTFSPAFNSVFHKIGRYQYDPDSNITHIQRQAGADIQGSTDYRYDRLDRLIQASPSLSLQELVLPHEHYSYDAVHNRSASAHQPGPWQYASGNRLTQWGQQQQATRYQYNSSGHITQKTQGETNNPGSPGTPNASTTSYHYDAAQRLVHIEQNGQTIARYHYDPKGRRIAKTTGQGSGQTTTWYIYAEEGLIAEINEQGQTQKSYGWEPDSPWGTKILWQADHGSAATKTYHYIHSDHLGTPQIATDKNGNQTWAQVSEAFGKATISANASTEINIRFPGQYYDKETGTHYNFHRDYDPSTGRYLQSDPIGLGDGGNYYIYAKQMVLKMYDSKGLYSACRNCKPRTDEECCRDNYGKFFGPSTGNDGIVMCCDGRKVPCASMGSYSDPDAREIYYECIMRHEIKHLPDSDCGAMGCGDKDWPAGSSNQDASECRAYGVSASCFRDKLNKCKTDACRREIQYALDVHEARKKFYCKNLVYENSVGTNYFWVPCFWVFI
ncbi:RHS repeat-associated core domain-containing protein [Vandammella animalimorsus]|uniref:RHS repeat domain-containing protein n=1 Tax=Vandammella animalimorsus TaxID=2029117 RepID=UPI00325BC3F5